MFATKPEFELTCAIFQAQISDLRNLMDRDLTPSLQLTHVIMHSSELVSRLVSKSAPKHRVSQVHQGHDYGRTKPALEPFLKLTIPLQSQSRHSKGIADQCSGEITLGSFSESSLLASFVSLLLLLDLKLLITVIKRELRYLRAATCSHKRHRGNTENSHGRTSSLCFCQVLVYKTSAYL